jgi:hypothetical protein
LKKKKCFNKKNVQKNFFLKKIKNITLYKKNTLTLIIKKKMWKNEKETIILKDHDELYSIASDPDLISNVNRLSSAILEGNLEINIEDDLLSSFIGKKINAEEEKNDILSFIKKRLQAFIQIILWQSVMYGISFWINEIVQYENYKIRLPNFPNPTLVEIRWIFNIKTSGYDPKLYMRDGKTREFEEVKEAYFFIINSPDFNKKEYVCPVNSVKGIIMAYNNQLNQLKFGQKFPQFIIKDKYPEIKTISEYTLLMMYFMHKSGISSKSTPLSMNQILQTPASCDTTGSGTILEPGQNSVQLNTMIMLEKNVKELYDKKVFSGIHPDTIQIDNQRINTFRVNPLSEIEWIKYPNTPNELIKTLSEQKTKQIQVEFGITETKRTTTIGSQIEFKNANYTIHTYKLILEKILQRIIISSIFDSDPNVNRDDKKIFTKVEVFMNSDDIISEDTLKFLITLFKEDFKILRHFIKIGTGVDVYEVKFGRDFDENEIDENELNLTGQTETQDETVNPSDDNSKLEKLKEMIKDPTFHKILQKIMSLLTKKDYGLNDKEKASFQKILSLFSKFPKNVTNDKQRKRNGNDKDSKKISIEENPKKKIKLNNKPLTKKKDVKKDVK